MLYANLPNAPRIWVLDTSVLAKHSRTSVLHYQRSSGCDDPDWIVVPHHEPPIHWTLLAYQRHANKWWFFDSLNHGIPPGLATESHGQLKSFAHVLNLPDTHQACEEVRVPQQRDGYQCGFWVCAYITCFFANKRLPASLLHDEDARNEWITNFRRYIIKVFTNRPPGLHGLN